MTDFAQKTLDQIIDEMIADTLGDRQAAGIADVENLTGKHRQSIWRYQRQGKWPEAIYIGGIRRWPRPVLKAALLNLFQQGLRGGAA